MATVSSSSGAEAWSRKCTCAVETESDSDSDGEPSSVTSSVTPGDGHGDQPALPLAARVARRHSGVRDPIKTSHALHNSEALRQAHALQNVFCACYESDTVLALIAKRERVFSPVQAMLLAPENVAQVFAYATSFPSAGTVRSGGGAHHHHRKASLRHAPSSAEEKALPLQRGAVNPLAEPEKYRRPYIATEIIVRFYLKAVTWHGAPKVLESPSPAAVRGGSNNSSGSETDQDGDQLTGARLSPGAAAPDKKPPSKHFLLDFSGFHHASLARLGLGRASSGSAASSRFSDLSEASASVRGFILHIEDLTLVEWKRIFASIYRFLWAAPASGDARVGEGALGQIVAASATEHLQLPGAGGIDSVLLANMCRVTKNFAVYPSVHAILSSIDVPGGDSLFARLARHAYNPEVSSLLHGLVHLARGRQYPFEPIIRSLVREIIDVPFELPSAAAATSLLTPKYNLRDPLVHARISGCADVLVKVLTQQFPNTFSYYIQQKLQLASFESVEAFEREIFPPKVLPNDRSLHEPIKSGVLLALFETPYIVMRLAEIGVAEIRFLDANHTDRVGIPPVLVMDVLKCAIELAVADKDRLKLLVPPVQMVVEALCASINYHQHISTISEFAARDCFSDSDSEDSQEDGDELVQYDVSRSDAIQNHSAHHARHPPPAASPVPASEVARRQLRESVISPPAMCVSPTSGKRVVNHRPLASTLLVAHVVEFMDAVIRMGKGSLDAQLAKFDLAMSLLDLFEMFPKANILHCRIVKLYLNLFDRVAPNGRVNNPLLRSVFRPPDSLLDFILRKLHQSAGTHPYDAHLAILGVKIDKICSSPRLEQELIRQYCSSMAGWSEFCSSLVASHYQQIDALDDAVLGISSLSNGTMHHGARSRTSSDGADDVFPLARPTSSATGFLSQELEPFRRLPMEQEGFGSPQNLAAGNEAINPTDMFRSRSQSQYPQSIIDVLKADSATSFDAVEDDTSISGFVYQKRSRWVKVHLRFEKESCLLVLEDAVANGHLPVASSPAKAKSTSKLKQFLRATTQHWTSRQKKLVVCNARQWIAFGRSVKNPGIGAFGFQVETFDRSREVDETLTFVTRSDAMRTLWYEGMQHAMTASQALRNSITEEDTEANIILVKCVATKREHHAMLYYAVPNVHLLGPVLASTFFLKSEVPEELPFWGTFHGVHGITQYVSLLNRCVRVLAVEEKRMYASGYSVIVEFDAKFQRVEAAELERKMPAPRGHGASEAAVDDVDSVTCSCTDTYLVTGNQIIGLTRTIADSEKLMQILSDYE
ncbi:hypothetical protein PybrP1_008987 [[Pythium] brassicae (nom. inval.)]|nr:hypothetical protein PybrP1_008987 [[Pythium] brassicae (nom. inval.)]